MDSSPAWRPKNAQLNTEPVFKKKKKETSAGGKRKRKKDVPTLLDNFYYEHLTKGGV